MLENINHNLHEKTTLYTPRDHRMETIILRPDSENGEMSGLTDRVTLQSESTSALTYSSSMTLNTEEDVKYGMLQSLVANLLKEQGINTKIAFGDNEVDIATITPEEARDLTADDGYFGVDKTSDRIFQFAIGIAGGDPSRIKAIKEGVDKGFQEALEAFGGNLPNISYDTYDAVMEKLDNWVTESQSAA
jgi:hypothetical protein